MIPAPDPVDHRRRLDLALARRYARERDLILDVACAAFAVLASDQPISPERLAREVAELLANPRALELLRGAVIHTASLVNQGAIADLADFAT